MSMNKEQVELIRLIVSQQRGSKTDHQIERDKRDVNDVLQAIYKTGCTVIPAGVVDYLKLAIGRL